jgi:hypothetical protein
MQIYTRETLDALPHTATDQGWPMLAALVREGPRPFVDNVDAEVRALMADDAVLPLLIVDGECASPNAYVCSPTTHYIDYARREVELELAGRPLLRSLLPPVLEALRPLLRWSQAERIVYVNNWLLSTNLYPKLGRAALQAIRESLTAGFPSHAIVFRSLNEGLNSELIGELKRLGFRRVFSRQVYLLDPRDGGFRRRNNYGNDRRLRQRSPYRGLGAGAIAPTAAGRLCALYRDLYLDKYSPYNPQLTPYYVERALQEGWLTISALALGEQIDGVLGTIVQQGVLTAPLVGYDRSRGEGAGLYRLLMLELIEQAWERQLILHLSSGAASFKRLRGAEPQIEYSLVYDRHLPPRRQLPWRLLERLSRRVIIPLMRRYGL